ncbi:MAG: hypothetical protein COB53_07900 [Elusimicrobia bacterium]|nr:MAG: hypothetical protein COB53_07900 [Elusimicrobiota bacterium]
MQTYAFNAENAGPDGARLSLRLFLGLISLILISVSISSAEVSVQSLTGAVRTKKIGSNVWNRIAERYVLAGGEEVRTGRRAKMVLQFQDGSRVELGPKTSFTIENAGDKKKDSFASMTLGWGKMKAWVRKRMARRFRVRTPTAVCSVRGTEFAISVDRNTGATQIDLFTGLLGVGDNQGNETLLKDGQSVAVTQAGLGTIQGSKQKQEKEDAKKRAALKREVDLSMSKEEVLAAAAAEIKSAEYQLGKVITDVNGNRVRLSQYIVRPAPNVFKLVTLNERPNRFDFFFKEGTFNKALPIDISIALRQTAGCVDTACEFFMRSFRTGYSNTTDNVLETASGGHLVDINNNGVAGDDVTAAFDSNANDFVTLAANQPFFTTLFDTEDISFNGVSHGSWVSGVGAYAFGAGTGCVGAGCGGVQSYGDAIGAGDQRTLTTVVSIISGASCSSLDECTGNREEGLFHDIVYRQNGTGTIWDKFENYVILDDGTIVPHSAFAGVTGGADFKARLLRVNYQQIITASEFGGRKIDLVFEPKTLIESGLIP